MANAVSIARPVLVAWHGDADAERDQWLWKVYLAWGGLSQGSSVSYSGYLSIGVASCGFYWHWNNYGIGSTTTWSECFGHLQPLHETHYGICDSGSDHKNCCQVPMARVHISLQSTDQAPEWLRSQLWEQHYQWAVWAHRHPEGKNVTLPSPVQWTGGVSPPNTDTDHWEIG